MADGIASQIVTQAVVPDSLQTAFDAVAGFLQTLGVWAMYAWIVVLFLFFLVMLYYMGKLPVQLYTWYQEYRGVIRRIFRLDTF